MFFGRIEKGDEMIYGDKELFVKKLRSNLYLMDEAHEATGYILIGEERAAVIDTMMGYNNLQKAVREVTDKPIIVINTHGHPDHIYGNVYFDRALISKTDKELAQMFLSESQFVEGTKKKNLTVPPFECIEEGDVIDLGGITLKVYALPGHTFGELVLLCPEERILFTGDGINHHLYMQGDGCLSIEDAIKAFDRIMFLENEADVILHGHAQDYDDITLMRAQRDGLQEILDGKTDNDTIYKSRFGGESLYHEFSVPEGRKFQQNKHGILYNADRIFTK